MNNHQWIAMHLVDITSLVKHLSNEYKHMLQIRDPDAPLSHYYYMTFEPAIQNWLQYKEEHVLILPCGPGKFQAFWKTKIPREDSDVIRDLAFAFDEEQEEERIRREELEKNKTDMFGISEALKNLSLYDK